MKKSLDLLNAIQIPKPCPANWGDMIGDDHARYCGICEKHVYNLSAMSAEAAADLVREKEGDLCVRLYKRLDGTVMTADCHPAPTTSRVLKHITTAATFAASLFVAGCGVSEPGEDTQAQPQATQNNNDPNICVMGEPAMPMMGGPAPIPPAVMGKICPPDQPARIDDSKEVLTIEPREAKK